MSETPESSVPPAPAPPPAFAAPPAKHDPLYLAAAWVVIVVGILFIALSIVWAVFAFLWW